MQGKYVKVMPHNVNPLKNYDYTCYLDSKLDKVSESFILQKIDRKLDRNNKKQLFSIEISTILNFY